MGSGELGVSAAKCVERVYGCDLRIAVAAQISKNAVFIYAPKNHHGTWTLTALELFGSLLATPPAEKNHSFQRCWCLVGYLWGVEWVMWVIYRSFWNIFVNCNSSCKIGSMHSFVRLAWFALEGWRIPFGYAWLDLLVGYLRAWTFQPFQPFQHFTWL